MSEEVQDAIVTVIEAYMDATCNLDDYEEKSVARALYTFAANMICKTTNEEIGA